MLASCARRVGSEPHDLPLSGRSARGRSNYWLVTASVQAAGICAASEVRLGGSVVSSPQRLAPAAGDRQAAIAAEILRRDLQTPRVLPPPVLRPGAPPPP